MAYFSPSLKPEIPSDMECTSNEISPSVPKCLSLKRTAGNAGLNDNLNQNSKVRRSLSLKKRSGVKLEETQSTQIDTTNIRNKVTAEVHSYRNNCNKNDTIVLENDLGPSDSLQNYRVSDVTQHSITLHRQNERDFVKDITCEPKQEKNVTINEETVIVEQEKIFDCILSPSKNCSEANTIKIEYKETEEVYSSNNTFLCNHDLTSENNNYIRNDKHIKPSYYLDDRNSAEDMYLPNRDIITDIPSNYTNHLKIREYQDAANDHENNLKKKKGPFDKASLSQSIGSTEFFLLDTVPYKTSYSFSFGLTECKHVNVITKNVNIESIHVSDREKVINIDCEVIEKSQDSLDPSQNVNKNLSLSHKKPPTVSIEMKKNMSENSQSKVLILNTNVIKKLSYVIVQPPNYKSGTRKIIGNKKLKSSDGRRSVYRSRRDNGNNSSQCDKLAQSKIDRYFPSTKAFNGINNENTSEQLWKHVKGYKTEYVRHDDMSKNSVRADTARSDGIGRLSCRNRYENDLLKLSKMPFYNRDNLSPMRQDIKPSTDAVQLPSPRSKIESVSSCSPRKQVDSSHFHPSKTKSNKSSVLPREIPYYKIVAGTHLAVDAFCYGDIPGVKHYFLTHFHSDHYSGLKKSFNKLLFCSQITANLCTSRLGVNPKCMHIINIDETIKIDGVEVTAIDSNHCPGAVMLVFTLPNGKTLLHTGDFRATPAMESYPIFWNRDIHTIYLDTTYCNPRYDFPTQEQSIEMAVRILQEKKSALERAGNKFSSVLIVCGTYTIGKEKFFLGVARSVGCAVWACAEKDQVLQKVEGRSFGRGKPEACQLHVVPMRDLTHEKLRSYLDKMRGSFSEVVAFKPSGWENGRNTTPPITKDMVTIHGIPYSEHSSFSEMIRFVNFLKPKQVIPTVDISSGVKAVQKYFPCPLVYKDVQCQSKLTDFFSTQNRQQISAVS